MPPQPYGRPPAICGTAFVQEASKPLMRRYIAIDKGKIFIYEHEAATNPLTKHGLRHSNLNNQSVPGPKGQQTGLKIKGPNVEPPGLLLLLDSDADRMDWASTIIDASMGNMAEDSEDDDTLPPAYSHPKPAASPNPMAPKRHSLGSLPDIPSLLEHSESGSLGTAGLGKLYDALEMPKNLTTKSLFPLPGESLTLRSGRAGSMSGINSLPNSPFRMHLGPRAKTDKDIDYILSCPTPNPRPNSMPINSRPGEVPVPKPRSSDNQDSTPPPIPRRTSVRPHPVPAKKPLPPLRKAATTPNVVHIPSTPGKRSESGSPASIPEDYPLNLGSSHDLISRSRSVSTDSANSVQDLLAYPVKAADLPEDEKQFVLKCVAQVKSLLQMAVKKKQASDRELELAEQERKQATEMRQQAAEILKKAQMLL